MGNRKEQAEGKKEPVQRTPNARRGLGQSLWWFRLSPPDISKSHRFYPTDISSLLLTGTKLGIHQTTLNLGEGGKNTATYVRESHRLRSSVLFILRMQ